MVLFSNELSIKCEVTNHCHSLSTPLRGIYFGLKGTYVWKYQPIVISSWEE